MVYPFYLDTFFTVDGMLTTTRHEKRRDTQQFSNACVHPLPCEAAGKIEGYAWWRMHPLQRDNTLLICTDDFFPVPGAVGVYSLQRSVLTIRMRFERRIEFS